MGIVTLLKTNHFKLQQDKSKYIVWLKDNDLCNTYIRYLLLEETDLEFNLRKFMIDYREVKDDEDGYFHKMSFKGFVLQPLQQWKMERKHMLKYDELQQFINDIGNFMMMIQANEKKTLPYIPHTHIFAMEYDIDDDEADIQTRVLRFIPFFMDDNIMWCSMNDNGDLNIHNHRQYMYIPTTYSFAKHKYCISPELDACMMNMTSIDVEYTELTNSSWVYSLGLLCIYLYKNERDVFTKLYKKYNNYIDDIKHTPLYHCIQRCLDEDATKRTFLYL